MMLGVICSSKLSERMQTLNDSIVPSAWIILARSPLPSRSPFFIGTMNLQNEEMKSIKELTTIKLWCFSFSRACNGCVLGMQHPCKSNCIFLSWNQSKFRQKLLYDWCDNNVSPFLFQQILVVYTMRFIVKRQLAPWWIDKIPDHKLHQKEQTSC